MHGSLVHHRTPWRLRVVPEVPRWNNATGNNLVGPPFSLFHATGGTDETAGWEERREREGEREEGQTMTRARRNPWTVPLHSVNCRNRRGRGRDRRSLITGHPSPLRPCKNPRNPTRVSGIYTYPNLPRINKHFSRSTREDSVSNPTGWVSASSPITGGLRKFSPFDVGAFPSR